MFENPWAASAQDPSSQYRPEFQGGICNTRASGIISIREGSRGTGGWGRAGGAQHQAVLHCICGLSRLRQQHSQGPRAGVLEKQDLCWNSASRFFISLGEVECTLWGAGALGSNHHCRSPVSSLLGLRLLFCRMGVIIIASNSLDCSVLKRQYEEEF